MQKVDGLPKLIAAHRRALNAAESLGARLMETDSGESLLIGLCLDAAFAAELVARRRVAAAPVTTMREVKLKAAYFKRLMNKDWCELEPADIRALLRSFANVPA
ncbi:MAG: hypothetical protein EPN45_17420 [Rhizobiaceae bacterium]|nr:MAG: hypothetical protein EPN45_17420 [Rhizobiaceae bacterium]